MGSEGIGTGLLVAEDRVLTNRHVFDRIKGPATFDLEPEPSSQARAGLELGEAVPIENSLQVDVALMEVVRTDVPEPVSWSTVAVDGAIAVVGVPYEEVSPVPQVQANISKVFGACSM